MPLKPLKADDFNGQWSYSRNFDDGTKGIGHALFIIEKDNVLRFSETGTITLTNGTTLNTFQSYKYKINPKGFDILFEAPKNGIFQSVKLKSKNEFLVGTATHFCGNDIYVSQYTFFDNQCFEILHNVRGPKKKYTSKTTFKKLID